jgi:hypothetical protein
MKNSTFEIWIEKLENWKIEKFVIRYSMFDIRHSRFEIRHLRFAAIDRVVNRKS